MAPKKNNNFVGNLAAFIVQKKSIFFLVYIIAIAFSLISMSWVEVENDVTQYLSEDTEIRQGLEAMNGNFTVYSTAQVMLKNVTYETALAVSQQIEKIDGVSAVVFANDESHYKDAAALIDVNFNGTDFSEVSTNALAQIRETIAHHDSFIYTTIGSDMNAMLAEEMAVILVVAVIIILVV